MNQRIERNIEQYRKGDATIEVVDAAGKPVPGVRVEVQQTGHEFLFGCNAFVLGQLKTAEENQRYEEAFLRLFNFATVPFYWEGTEPAQGELRYQEGSRDIWRRPPPDRYLPWAAKHGVTLKGHPLLWHAYNPPWLPKDADAAARAVPQTVPRDRRPLRREDLDLRRGQRIAGVQQDLSAVQPRPRLRGLGVRRGGCRCSRTSAR